MPCTNIRPSYIVFLLYLLMNIQPIRGQEDPLTLCETQSPVTVRDLSGGTIQHVQRTAGEPADECQLVLTGFSSSAYVSLPGVERSRKLDPCSIDDSPEIIINGVSYCVQDYAGGVIIALTNGRLTLKTNQITESFSLDYYSNVAICGGDDSSIMIPSNAAHDQLSCIIANIGTQTCSTAIRNLQGRSAMMELLHPTSGNGEAATFNGFEITKADPIILRNPGDELVITHTPAVSRSFRYVVIKLTVLTCEEAPQVQNSTIDISPGPWFSGSQANYTCSEEGYEFKNTSSVTCQLNFTNQRLQWSDASNIMCIPVECQMANIRADISNGMATEDSYYYLDTLSYVCDEGYVKRGSVSCRKDGNWSAEPQCVTEKPTGAPAQEKTSRISLIVGSVVGVVMLICLVVLVAIIMRRRRSRPDSSSSDIYQSPNINLQTLDDNHVYARPEEHVYINGHVEDEDTDSSPYLPPVPGALEPPAVYEEVNTHIYNNA